MSPCDAIQLLIIPLQFSSVTSYFDAYSSSIEEYENEDIQKIHLTAKEPPWDTSTIDYLERKNLMLDHQGQISIPETVARGLVYVNTVISYSLAYYASDVMDIDNLAAALSAQIQISIVLIGTVRKPLSFSLS